MKTEKKNLRKLGGIERYHLMLENYLHTNVVIYAVFNGNLSEEVLRQTLQIVQNKYILLQVGVKRRRIGTRFETGTGASIPLRVIHCTTEDRNKELEHEINTMLPIATGPLARCVLAIHEKNNTLIMTMSHTIADGTSAITILQNIFDAAEKIYQGKKELSSSIGE